MAIALHADKKSERCLHIAVPAFVGMIGYLLLVVLKDRGSVAMYIAAIITTTGVFANIPSMLALTSLHGGHTKRGVATAFIVSIGVRRIIVSVWVYSSID